MILDVLRLSQSETTLYLTHMTAEQLLACSYTAEWDPNLGWDIDQQGFQRAPVRRHYEGIGRFLSESSNPFIPTAALLSAEESQYGILRYKSLSPSAPDIGTLTIPEGRQLLILDYQHRHRGLRYAIEELGATHLNDFTMPVVVVRDIPRYEEIRQFYLINSKQRRIDTDLALALLQTLASSGIEEHELENLVGPGKRFRIRATRLTFNLAARADRPWAGRIAQPHDLVQPQAVIKIKSFVDSLAPVVSRRAECSKLGDDDLLDALTSFWEAVAAMVPGAFKDPSQYQIQRTVGVYAFHLVFARKVYDACVRSGSLSRVAFRRVLGRAPPRFFHEEFWKTRGEASLYVGSSGYRELARLIMRESRD